MANSDKNILITPQVGGTPNPTIVFTGADNNPVTLRVLDDGTLSIEGSSGQLFSVSDSLTGTIFSVNDISGIPSIEVLSDGTVTLAEFGGSVGIGTASPSTKLEVDGTVTATSFSGRLLTGSSTQAGTTYTMALSDSGTAVLFSSSSAVTVTIPTEATASWPSGTGFAIVQNGTGQVTVQGASGVTINSSALLKTRTQYSALSLLYLGSDTWAMTGDMAVYA